MPTSCQQLKSPMRGIEDLYRAKELIHSMLPFEMSQGICTFKISSQRQHFKLGLYSNQRNDNSKLPWALKKLSSFSENKFYRLSNVNQS
jgi:hypothetical protein